MILQENYWGLQVYILSVMRYAAQDLEVDSVVRNYWWFVEFNRWDLENKINYLSYYNISGK